MSKWRRQLVRLCSGRKSKPVVELAPKTARVFEVLRANADPVTGRVRPHEVLVKKLGLKDPHLFLDSLHVYGAIFDLGDGVFRVNRVRVKVVARYNGRRKI